jgi:hypothetical protein
MSNIPEELMISLPPRRYDSVTKVQWRAHVVFYCIKARAALGMPEREREREREVPTIHDLKMKIPSPRNDRKKFRPSNKEKTFSETLTPMD